MSIDFNQRTAYLREIGRAARKKSSIRGNELGVLSNVVNIYSDGVRLSATIWRPDRVEFFSIYIVIVTVVRSFFERSKKVSLYFIRKEGHPPKRTFVAKKKNF